MNLQKKQALNLVIISQVLKHLYQRSMSFKYDVLGRLAATLVKSVVRLRSDVPLMAMAAPKYVGYKYISGTHGFQPDLISYLKIVCEVAC